MHTQAKKGEGIIAYNVMNLTPTEMNTIIEMDKKIADTLISHHPKSKGKKLYLTDDDLFTIRGILSSLAVFGCSIENTFNIQKNELIKQFNEAPDEHSLSQVENPVPEFWQKCKQIDQMNEDNRTSSI